MGSGCVIWTLFPGSTLAEKSMQPWRVVVAVATAPIHPARAAHAYAAIAKVAAGAASQRTTATDTTISFVYARFTTYYI